MAGAAHSYAYLRRSGADPAGRRARLQTSGGVTVAGPAANPRFFTGFLTGAEQAAAGLLAVADVARARYYQPQPAGLRDPVVTCNGDRLRFESFSGCCGVYARLDVLSEALDGEVHDRGTTNVDVNGAAARGAGPRRRRRPAAPGGRPRRAGRDHAGRAGGGEEGAAARALAARLRRGAGASRPASTCGPSCRRPRALRFLRSLPGGARGPALWAVPAGRSLRLTSPAGAGRGLPGRARSGWPRWSRCCATPAALRVYGPVVGAGEPAVGQRLGAGAGRHAAAADAVAGAVSRASPARGRCWTPWPATRSTPTPTWSGRCWPSSRGSRSTCWPSGPGCRRPGCGPRWPSSAPPGGSATTWPRRPTSTASCPTTPAGSSAMNPRLRNARALVAAGAVRLDGDAGHAWSSTTTSTGCGSTRTVGAACTCPWWAAYRGGRGRCKHVLAAELARAGQPAGRDAPVGGHPGGWAVSTLDWPALRALIDSRAGPPGRGRRGAPGRAAAPRPCRRGPGLRPAARQRLRGGLAAGAARRIAALRVAGVGCLSGADTVARWLTRQDLRTWDEAAQHAPRSCGCCGPAQVPWLPELTRRLAARLRHRPLGRPPVAAGRRAGHSHGTAGDRAADQRRVRARLGAVAATRRAARRHPGRRPLLRCPGPAPARGGRGRWAVRLVRLHRGCRRRPAGRWPWPPWPRPAGWSGNGLLDRCLGRLLQGGPARRAARVPAAARGPGPDPGGGGGPDAATTPGCWPTGPSRVAQTAQRALRRLDDAGRLEPDRLVEASRAVLFRPEKHLVRTQLSWLDAVARRQPERAGRGAGRGRGRLRPGSGRAAGPGAVAGAAPRPPRRCGGQGRAAGCGRRTPRRPGPAGRLGPGQPAAGPPADAAAGPAGADAAGAATADRHARRIGRGAGRVLGGPPDGRPGGAGTAAGRPGRLRPTRPGRPGRRPRPGAGPLPHPVLAAHRPRPSCHLSERVPAAELGGPGRGHPAGQADLCSGGS